MHDVQRGYRTLRGQQCAKQAGVADHRVNAAERVQPTEHVAPLVGSQPDLSWHAVQRCQHLNPGRGRFEIDISGVGVPENTLP